MITSVSVRIAGDQQCHIRTRERSNSRRLTDGYRHFRMSLEYVLRVGIHLLILHA